MKESRQQIKQTEIKKNRMEADSFRQLTIWDVIQQCENPTYSVKSLFAGCGAKIYSNAGFDGIAVGGMVPRAKDREYIKMVVRAVREEAPRCLIHVFGCGNPDLIPELIEAGADSFDSSSYIRKAADRTGNGSGIHTGMYEAIRQLYQIEETMKGASGSYNINVPNYWVV